MIKLSQAVIVEGKYDKIRLSNILDCLIIETDGFGIFKNKEKQTFLKRLAREKGIIILTDSDSAGFMIRNYICNIVGHENVKNVFIPDIYGKEKRKICPSAEGKLGVEGINDDILIEALTKAGITSNQIDDCTRKITNLDLYLNGLSGTEGSHEKRVKFMRYVGLPERLGKKNLLKTLNTFLTYDDFIKAIKEAVK